jgi:hypothetical protein
MQLLLFGTQSVFCLCEGKQNEDCNPSETVLCSDSNDVDDDLIIDKQVTALRAVMTCVDNNASLSARAEQYPPVRWA